MSYIGDPYFKPSEFQCHCGCGGTLQDEIISRLVNIREEAGFPIIITSAYRCPAYNAKVSSSGFTGPHTTGRAVDIKTTGEQGLLLLKLALKHSAVGIGVSLNTKSSKFLHVDWCVTSEKIVRPQLWSY